MGISAYSSMRHEIPLGGGLVSGIFFGFCMVFICLCFSSTIHASSYSNNTIFIELPRKGLTLNRVVPVLTEQTGYKILVEEHYKDILVKGKYKNVDIEEFFRRVFKGQNYSLLLNKEKREVQVFILGKKKHASSYLDNLCSTAENISECPELSLIKKRQIQKGKIKYEHQGIDSVSGLPIEKMKAMRAEQIRIGREKYVDQGIDSVSGLPIEKMKAMRAEQIRIGRKMYEDQGINSVTGLPIKK
jgi:hypothetical protein